MASLETKAKLGAIRDYFARCPYLKNGALNVDYLDASQTVQYSINTSMTADPIEKRYVDGGKVKVFPFTFQSSDIYSEDVANQLDTNLFYDNLIRWIELNNEAGILPDIDGAIELVTKNDGYLFNTDSQTARYQLDCELRYYEGY